LKNFLFLFLISLSACHLSSQVLPGAHQTHQYISLLKDKNVAVLTNQSGLIGKTHLVDSLLSLNIHIIKVFAPEHGFRGQAEAGAHIKDNTDIKTGLPIMSLYGKNNKASKEQLKNVDIMIFDLQGVGARFYTYISSLKLMMEACAENHIPLLILDRPNPNPYIDGPVLDTAFSSFVGALPIPVVYNMTDGELAQMINGEYWLEDHLQCELIIIKNKNYTHHSAYQLPVKPSPNLPNFQSIYLYPSLCFFEGTKISVGRGTDMPFQIIGHPAFTEYPFTFTPKSITGISQHPKFENQNCYGLNLQGYYPSLNDPPTKLNLSWLLDFYHRFPNKKEFFNSFFDKLAGTDLLRKQIEKNWSEKTIRDSWQEDLDHYKKIRRKYLLYPD